MWLPSTSASVIMMIAAVAQLIEVQGLAVVLGSDRDAEGREDVAGSPRSRRCRCSMGLLDVQDLTAQRHDSLEIPVAALIWPYRLRSRPRRRRSRPDRTVARREQSASLPGSPATRTTPFCAARVRAPCGPRAGPWRPGSPSDTMALGVLRVLLQIVRPRAGNRLIDGGRRPRRCPSLVLVCPSNCGSCTLTETISGKTLRGSRRR